MATTLEFDAAPDVASGVRRLEFDAAPAASVENTSLLQHVGNNIAGQVRGAAGIGANFIAPFKAAWEGTGQSGAQAERKRIINDVEDSLRWGGADPNSAAYKIGNFGAGLAGTAGVGPAQMSTRFIPRLLEGTLAGGAGTAMISPEDTGVGAGVGGAVSALAPPILKAGAKAAGRVSDFVTGNLGKVRAAELLRDVAGPQQAVIQQAWQNAPEGLTAAQAAASAQNDVIPALGAVSALDRPAEYRLLAEGQQAARDATMGAMARGSTAEDAALARDWFSKATAAELVPIRDSILQKMRETGKTLDEVIPLLGAKEATYVAALQNQGVRLAEAAQQGVVAQGGRATQRQTINALPPGNFPRETSMPVSPSLSRANPMEVPAVVSGEGTPAAATMSPAPFGTRGTPAEYAARVGENQAAAAEAGAAAATARTEADALRAQISSLPSSFTAAPVREAVAARMASTVNPAEESVMSAVQKALQRAGDDPVAIAEVRRLGVNQLVGDLLASGKLSKTDAAAALTDVKKLIDKQLGPEIVDRYFKPYSKKLEYRASLELADNLRQLQKGNPTEFLKVMRGDNPDLVAKYGDWPTIQQALGERRFGKAAGVAAEIQRDADLAARASSATAKLGDLVRNDKFRFTVPWGLSPKAALVNRTLQSIESSLNKKTKDLISQAMLSGKSANELMSILPAHQRNAGMKWIAAGGPARYAAKAVPAAVSQ